MSDRARHHGEEHEGPRGQDTNRHREHSSQSLLQDILPGGQAAARPLEPGLSQSARLLWTEIRQLHDPIIMKVHKYVGIQTISVNKITMEITINLFHTSTVFLSASVNFQRLFLSIYSLVNDTFLVIFIPLQK